MKRSISQSWPWLAGAFAFGVAVPLIMAVIARVAGRPYSFMTEDPLQTAKMPFYTGMLSNLGAVLWAGAAASSLLCAILLRRRRRLSLFMGVSGLVTGYLLVDDLFMMHEQFLRNWVHLPEKLVFSAYAVMFIGYALFFMRDILADDHYPVLGAASLFLVSSMIYDALAGHGDRGTFFEDTLKFIGISLWFTYFFSNSVRWIEKFGEGMGSTKLDLGLRRPTTLRE